MFGARDLSQNEFLETATQLSGFNETLVDELNSKKILLIGAGGLAHP